MKIPCWHETIIVILTFVMCLKGLYDVLKPYNAIMQSCIINVHTQYTSKNGVIFKVKPVKQVHVF